jgi:hypothetical protein
VIRAIEAIQKWNAGIDSELRTARTERLKSEFVKPLMQQLDYLNSSINRLAAKLQRVSEQQQKASQP